MNTKTPLWHLVAVITVLLSVSFASSLGGDFHPEPQAHHAVLQVYFSVIVVQWLTVLLVLWKWPWRPHNRWRGWRPITADVASAAGFCLAFTGIGKAAVALLGPGNWGAPGALLPADAIEMAAFVLVSVNAGICEEIIFRGYLYQQLALRSGRVSVAILGQAILFGASHGYQSVKSMALIMVWGVLYGLLVTWRRTLAPGMLAHAWLDIAGVIIK